MRKLSLNIRLLIVFTVVMIGFVISESCLKDTEEKTYSIKMQQAVELTKKWFRIIQVQKEIRGIESDAKSNIPYRYMLGDDYTFLTTTIGTLNAKEISANPDFAALMVRWIEEANIKPGDKVGIIVSGSFPALAISTLAAMETLGLDIVLMSSLGASSYGANQSNATWLDMENWLIEYGDMKYKSTIVSIGAENDNGLGIIDEGIELIREAAGRNERDLFIPENLMHSINKRVEILVKENVSLLINIGGNQTAVGRCAHSAAIPNGFNEALHLCHDEERGIIQELNSKGVPIINLLNIKDLAFKYGIDISPGKSYAKSSMLFNEKKTNKVALSIVLGMSILIITVIKSK